MVEPFEGPKCGIEKQLIEQKELLDMEATLERLARQLKRPLEHQRENKNTPIPRGSQNDGSPIIKELKAGRIWITIDTRGTFISFDPKGSAKHGVVHIRIDGNKIWTMIHKSPDKEIALHGKEAHKIIGEMKNGKILYMRPKSSFAESYKSKTLSEEFGLFGFAKGLKIIEERFKELDRDFPSDRRRPVNAQPLK